MNSPITMVEPELLEAAAPSRHPAPATVAAQALANAAQPATPALLLQMAVQQGADLARLEKLMELQERWEANEARKAFVVAMTAFKAEPLEIFKRKQVGYETDAGGFVGYKHAELSDVTDVVGPAMARHQLSFRWDIKQEPSRVTVTCIVTHVMGHSERVEMFGAPDNSGKKNAIQQIASTCTYFQRYSLLAVTGLSTKDMEDDDGAGAGDATAEARRAQWLKDQIENIEGARTVRELKKIMEYALGKARENNDQDMEDQLTAARDAKVAQAQPSTGAPA